MTQKNLKDIVDEMKELNEWYSEKLKWDYDSMSTKEQFEFLKLSNGLRENLEAMRDLLDKIEDLPYQTDEK